MYRYEYRDENGNLLLTKVVAVPAENCGKCGSPNVKDKGSWYKCLEPNCYHRAEHCTDVHEGGQEVNKVDDLAKRAVKCKGWRWMLGMRITHSGSPGCCYTLDEEQDGCPESGSVPPFWTIGGCEIPISLVGALPILEDPATKGALLHLVREAWKDPCLTVDHSGPGNWLVHTHNDVDGWVSCETTEAGALVYALEAADEN